MQSSTECLNDIIDQVSMSDDRFVVLMPRDTPTSVPIRPDLERDAKKVPENLAETFRECRCGRAPWPLFVHGGVGTGKSRFALIVSDWYGGLFVDFTDLLAEYTMLRRAELHTNDSKVMLTTNERKVHEWEWIMELKRPRVLIVDDVGRKGDTDRSTARELLARLMDARECMPTIVISNIGLGEIEQIYDDRVASRLCAGTVVKVTGDDKRLMK